MGASVQMRRRKISKKCLWALLSTIILCLNLVGCQDSELIAEQLKQSIKMAGSISDYVAMDKDNRVAICDNQHIEISGLVSNAGFTLFEVGNKKQDGMVISCTFDEHSDALEAIEDGDFVRIQGVCMGCYTDSMFMYGCLLVEHTKADEYIEESILETIEESVPEIEEIAEEETEEETVKETEEINIEVIETQEVEETVVAEITKSSPEKEAEPQQAAEPQPEPVPEPEPVQEPQQEPVPQAVVEPQQEAAIQVEPAPAPEPQPAPVQESGGSGAYAVNGKNGKIHIVGECPATGTGKNAMKEPHYFNTYEEADAYSSGIEGNPDKRKCGNCW